MEYIKINPKEIKENKYNPNEMTDSIMEHLVKEIKRIGFLQPILINKNKVIIDGEHRWKAAKEVGLKEIPCIQVDMDEKDAKLTTVNMNQIKGEINPVKFAELLKSLDTDFNSKELSDLLNISEMEIEQYDMLIDLADLEDIDLTPYEDVPSIKFEFDTVEERDRILSLVLSNQFGWEKKNKPNTFLLSKAVDEWCENNA
jgi:ParB/RepB/Spo0J family partition protein